MIKSELTVDSDIYYELLSIANDVIWLGSNLDKIKRDPDRFRRIYEAMLENAKAALASVDEPAPV